MEMLYYTFAAVLLYLASDWVLNRIEIRRGERFENRSLIFFVIILVLSVSVFNLVQFLRPVAELSPSAVELPAGEQAVTPQP